MNHSAASVSAMAGTDLLRGLPATVVEDFLRRVTLMTVPPESVIFHEGDTADRVLLLVAGRIKIVRQGEHSRENILIIAGPGELIGGLSIFDRGRQLTTAVTVGQAQIAELPADTMIEWLEAHPEAAMRFIRLLILRAQRQNTALHDVFGLDVGTRVARAILREARRFGRKTSEGVRVNMGLSQEELAQHVRASRESVNQTLSRFAKHGWIRRDGAEIVVLNMDRLARQAGEA
jgi:CRP/FNR family cyclic AMP-dependent transcriptional regulator